ncbi:MAG: transaldolase family protein [Pirellulaceae bacterium]
MSQNPVPPALLSLIESGTKLWLDSIDPELVRTNRAWGATGATSNPIIVADLLKSGRFDGALQQFMSQGLDDESIAWQMTDQLVRQAQDVFLPVWHETRGNDGYVSFEVDPLLEDPELGPPFDKRVSRYIELGRQWARGHQNRMIKVPATPAGLAALEELAASGVTLNVTLIFSLQQYRDARDAVWRGARRRANLDGFKSVYSIFVSRVDVYTEKHVPQLSPAAQGQVGIVNAKRIWSENQEFWRAHSTPCQQEIIFASTGVKKAGDSPWKYVAAFAGSGIQTNPPATNDAVAASNVRFTRTVAELPAAETLAEIDRLVDFAKLESFLMNEGIQKFAEPHRALLQLIADNRRRFAA